ncbi:MAG TPA: KpsF/GutQ family sugar-phosphate isomerase [Bacteroidetes bacterium]|nr:KpsF/GutQ family sugar-phosphate isomerase [Bacteroidota bacterium]
MNTTTRHKLIVRSALRTLDLEAAALHNLRGTVNATFCEVVDAIYALEGRVVVTGMGKSALVARKIVATFNSTGTPALFLHAADAVHGDLGMVQPADLLLCLSKSGSTAEIKVLVPLIKSRGIAVVGVAAGKDSWLARHADHFLLTPIDGEADPNGLAPTASTTAQMALGDAIAIALLALRGFQPADFAALHPGGILGKQLFLRVGDLYPLNERPAVFTGTAMQHTILEMTGKRLGCTVVLYEDKNASPDVAGIITDGDLRRHLERHGDKGIFQLSAKDIMTTNPKTISAGALAVKALEIMKAHSITQLVVLDEKNKYAGIVHLHDLIREGLF